MTHLGIVSAIATAARGFRVIGHDAEASLVGRLDRQYFPALKPHLDRLLAANRDRISFSAPASDLSDCDIVYIAAVVPTDDKGASDLAAISARPNRPDLTSSQDHAVLVVLCQVRPGFTHSVSTMPGDRLIYQVETLIFGRAVERALTTQRFIAGCADP